MDITVQRLFDILPYYENSFLPKDDVIAAKENGKWVKYDIKTYREIVNNISYAFLKLGVQAGDKIATISNNRPEWNFLDMGILQVGAIHVPIYPTISEADYQYILKHAEVKYVFVAGKELLAKIEHILPEVPSLIDLYTFKHIDKVKHLEELIELGKHNPNPEMLEERKKQVNSKDLATLIYTSGTTGNPKGVMLSHHNLLSNMLACKDYFPVDQHSRILSYLPLCHVYERMNIYLYQYIGVSIYYAENMGTIADNLREVKPHLFTSVPRLLEKVYDKIMAKGRKLKGIKRQLFFWAVNLGHSYELSGKSIFYKLQLKLANKIIFNKWREALGGQLRVIVSGGAAIQPRLARIYTAAGIPVLEGYGLTETSPVLAVNTFEPGGIQFGTVGKPIPGVELKIAEDGEILAKGPNVMMGYYKDPDMTAEAIKNGWFHTGDVGLIVPEGHLKITGRKKEIFKTSMGKYISPALIENKFKESPFIDGIIVLGENQKFAAALIVPDFDHLRSWCKVKGVPYSTNEQMIEEKVIRDRFKKEVQKLNADFGDYEKIKKFDLLSAEWSIQTGEMTANLKLKRAYIQEKYKGRIDKLFNN